MTTENNTTSAPAATLADYIDSLAAEGTLNSADNGLVSVEDVRSGFAGWLKGRIEANPEDEDSADLALDDLREVLENLEGAVADMRLFITNFFEQSGTLAKVRDAIVEFDRLPTDANRLKLADASMPLKLHRINMDAATKAIMRKYAVNRLWRSDIHFGVVHTIATSRYNPALIVTEAA